MAKLKFDLSGLRIGHMRVTGRAPKRPNDNHPWWRCECDCGVIFEARSQHIRERKIASCGCQNRSDDANANRRIRQLANQGSAKLREKIAELELKIVFLRDALRIAEREGR